MVTIPTIDQISGSTVMRKMRDLINHFITFAGEVDDELTTFDNKFDGYYTKIEVDGNFYTKSYINTNYYDKTSVDYLLTRKADVFALGNGLIWNENQLFAKIDGTTIVFDSSGRLKANVDVSNIYTKIEVDDLLDDKQDILTAGTGINITNDVISVTNAFDPTQYYNKTATDDLLDDKQDVLTAGTGITISNNVISATGGGSGSDWTVVNSTDWRTDIISIQAGTNTATFLKDCCVCISYSLDIWGCIFIPKGSKFSKAVNITFSNKITSGTDGQGVLSYVSNTLCSATLETIFGSNNTFSFRYATIKVNADGSTDISATNLTMTRYKTTIASQQGAYLLVK